MQIILVHPRFKQAVNLHVSLRLVTVVGCLLVLTAVGALTGVMLKLAAIDPVAAIGSDPLDDRQRQPSPLVSPALAMRAALGPRPAPAVHARAAAPARSPASEVLRGPDNERVLRDSIDALAV
ncbi:MAG: hypothetical protein JSW68_05605, partial [Burkholderiales bacterium]